MDFIKNKRLHDSLYLKENQYKDPKETFKFASRLIDKIAFNKRVKLLDVGCAAGDFLKYLTLTKDLNKYEFFGTDISRELIEASKKNVPQAKFIKYDFSKFDNNFDELFNYKFDIMTMFGVHSCFDNLEWIKNISYLLNSGGKAILWGILNPYPYDVLMRVKRSDSSEYESGWNIHSLDSIKKEAEIQNLIVEVINYQPNLDIQRNEDDFLRTWTINLGNNDHMKRSENVNNELLLETDRKTIYTNATRIIHDWCFCEFIKP